MPPLSTRLKSPIRDEKKWLLGEVVILQRIYIHEQIYGVSVVLKFHGRVIRKKTSQRHLRGQIMKKSSTNTVLH